MSWACILLRPDGSVPLTSWRFRFPKATRVEAEIALLQSALLFDPKWRWRLRVARYRMPAAKGEPVELYEVHELPLEGKRGQGIKVLLDRKQIEFEEACWAEGSRR